MSGRAEAGQKGRQGGELWKVGDKYSEGGGVSLRRAELGNLALPPRPPMGIPERQDGVVVACT